MRLSLRSSLIVMRNSLFRNASSRKRAESVSKLKLVVSVKISGSGLKRIRVPRFFVSPTSK